MRADPTKHPGFDSIMPALAGPQPASPAMSSSPLHFPYPSFPLDPLTLPPIWQFSATAIRAVPRGPARCKEVQRRHALDPPHTVCMLPGSCDVMAQWRGSRTVPACLAVPIGAGGAALAGQPKGTAGGKAAAAAARLAPDACAGRVTCPGGAALSCRCRAACIAIWAAGGKILESRTESPLALRPRLVSAPLPPQLFVPCHLHTPGNQLDAQLAPARPSAAPLHGPLPTSLGAPLARAQTHSAGLPDPSSAAAARQASLPGGGGRRRR